MTRHGESGFLVKTVFVFMVAMLSVQALSQNSSAEPKISPPRIKEVQVPFASLKPEATFKIGENADWVEITDDAVWVATQSLRQFTASIRRTTKKVPSFRCRVIPARAWHSALAASGYPYVANPTRLRGLTQAPTGSARFFPSGSAG